METLVVNLLSQLTGQGGAIAIVAFVAGFYFGMKVTIIRNNALNEENKRKQDEIEFLSEENRKLRADVRAVYNEDIRDNL